MAETPNPTPPAAPTTPAASAGPAAPGKGEPKPQITFEEFAKVDLRTAKVIKAENHPSADRLLKLQLDDGSGVPRQICAGIRGQYTAEEMVGRTIIIVANLAPRMIRGEESRGMLLAASDMPKDAAAGGDRKVVVLTTASEMPPGCTVS